jgi:hypothetical protein
MKFAQKMAQGSIFLVEINTDITFDCGKRAPYIWASYVFFLKKIHDVKQFPKRRKFPQSGHPGQDVSDW